VAFISPWVRASPSNHKRPHQTRRSSLSLHSASRWTSPILVSFLVLVAFTAIVSAQGNSPQSPAARQPAKTAPATRQILKSYEGQLVSTIEIAGRPDINADNLRQLATIKPGDKFEIAKVDASLAAIKATGQFQDVQLDVVPDVKGVRVLFVLQPGLYFGMYTFPGATGRFSYSRLLQISNYPPEGPFTPVDIEQARLALEKYFQRNGYFTSVVKPEVISDPEHGLVNVNFHTTLGKRAKFGEVSIEGATPKDAALLHGRLTSIMARLRGASIRKGKPYKLQNLQAATLYLTNALMKQDHLSAIVKLVGANYDPSTNRADISLHVDAGPMIKVNVEGAHLWSWTKRKLLPVYQQVGVDDEIIQEGRRNLISNFQQKGFFDTNVDVSVAQQNGGETIDYKIAKGKKHKVDDVKIAGNSTLSSDELITHVAVKPKHLLSHGQFSQKLVHTSVKNLEGVYRAAGFSTVKVTPEVKTEGGNIDVTFRVNEGPRDIVESLVIDGNSTAPITELAPKGLKIVAGQPYSQKLADEDRTQISARYLELGYLTATFRQSVRQIGNDKHRLAVTYQIYEGPQVKTSSVIVVGRDNTTAEFIDKNTWLPKDRPLTETAMLKSENMLYEPGIFDWAEVDPRRQITTQDQEDVIVKVHEAKRNTLVYGFGFEVINRGGSVPSGTVAVPGLPPVGLGKGFKTSQKTFWGPRGSLEYTRRNLRGKAESVTFSALGARLVQRGQITYEDPNFRYSSWAASILLSGEHNSENPIFTSRIGQGTLQFHKPLNSAHTQNLFLRYTYRQTGLANLLIPQLITPEDMHVRLSTLSANFVRDTRDSTLDAHKGIYESFQIDFNPKALGSSVNFTKFLGQTAYYRKIRGNTIWANSLRVGFETPLGDSHVPISEEFFSGGGGTLRGFPLNGAGPQNPITACGDPADTSTCVPIKVPLGGRQLLILNSEFRIPLSMIMKNLGVAAFYDGGNVFRNVGFHGQYTNSIGAGLRYATPVGPVRIDIGHNLNGQPGIKSTQIFITLGQAF
jgi:outer membrane protein insertion porin family